MQLGGLTQARITTLRLEGLEIKPESNPVVMLRIWGTRMFIHSTPILKLKQS